MLFVSELLYGHGLLMLSANAQLPLYSTTGWKLWMCCFQVCIT